ncbi:MULTISPECIES: hypothetical protein [Sorangium]|uniref:Uncharacterized protein n=1 Tax=Sorangium cellulosum TaxID=56 RepID=A0A4P2QYD1_SORCE|nr:MULTISPECIES: hypothetical protein [Sorangium]AUX35505.1 uncharacterized protein SOCE836_076990 [Sorangium cellulosum]WCQ94807.1 hypothetical protein NQZ70_07577 [Sorangium sp. Soce836]
MTIESEMSAAARSAERGFRPGPCASGALGRLFNNALPAFHEVRRDDGRGR